MMTHMQSLKEKTIFLTFVGYTRLNSNLDDEMVFVVLCDIWFAAKMSWDARIKEI